MKIGDLELHPPVWSRIFVPEGTVSVVIINLQKINHFYAFNCHIFQLCVAITKQNSPHMC